MAIPRALNPSNTFFKWLSRVSCLCFIIFQCGMLDYYIINYFVNSSLSNATNSVVNMAGYAYLGLIGVDLTCFLLFLAAAITSLDSYYRKRENGRLIGNGELPLGYIAWGFYAIQLAGRIGIIFDSNLVSTLNKSNFFGPSTLKTAFALCAVIFVQLILMHHDAPHSSCRHEYVNDIALGTSLDILDGVSVLNVMFDPSSPESNTNSPLHIAIVCVACVNLFLPTIPLFILSRDHFGKHRISIWFQIAYRACRIVFSDISMFVVRIMIVSTQDAVISVFAIKNLISLGMNLKWLLETLDSKDDEGSDSDDEHGHHHGHKKVKGAEEEEDEIEPKAFKMAFVESGEGGGDEPKGQGQGSDALLSKRPSAAPRLSVVSRTSRELCIRHRHECPCSCHRGPAASRRAVTPCRQRSEEPRDVDETVA